MAREVCKYTVSMIFRRTCRVKKCLYWPQENKLLGITCFSQHGVGRNFSVSCKSMKTSLVLGIETSCDDTGCAIVDSTGHILGETLHSQMQVHLEHGGIVPPVARNLHSEHIDRVIQETIVKAQVNIDEIDAIATTVKPGLPLSLAVGTNYGKRLAREHNKPFIPIHHMEAHALTVRMVQKVDFPFLVLLISGGHCLLAIAADINKFYLLGQSLDDAPGEAMDKTARRMSLRHIPELANVCGGRAVEILASRGDPTAFIFNAPLCKYRDCNFSVAGLKNTVRRHIMRQEHKFGLKEGDIVPGLEDICASFQLAIARHLCHRVQRGMEFSEMRGLIPTTSKRFVVSGGVACNSFIRQALQTICDTFNYEFYAPPRRLCTDNGIMIAWNGMEKWLAGEGIADDLDAVDIQGKCMLGIDMREEVSKAHIKCKWVKLKTITGLQHTHDKVLVS